MLVSDASHELRTPLTVLRAELELIARERPSGQGLQTAVGSAIEETDRLIRLADDLLLLARADDNQLAIAPKRLSTAELLRAAADRAHRHSRAAEVQILVDDSTDAGVLADRDRIAQAIDNLTLNAIQNTPAGGRITLQAEQSADRLVLSVADTGSGVADAVREQLFEPFVTGHPEGTGLGLAVVRISSSSVRFSRM